uniref:DUF4283 domain-containing protein n=1 Tax=Fagus sylvatica TaxID=28930 RepID=A0A2N9EJD0_FAGSY
MEENIITVSVDNLVSQTKRLGWNGGVVQLGIDSGIEESTKLLLLEKSNLLKIGRFIGRVTDIDLSGSGEGQWRNFVRVRVEMDISTPLLSGFPMDREQLLVLWIPLKWLRADNPDYHPGINKQLLLEAERAECSTEIRSLIRMARGSSGDVHSTPQCEKTKDNSGQRKVQLPLDMWNALVNEKERERVHLENTMPANDDPSSRDPANTAIGYDVEQDLITNSAAKAHYPPLIFQPTLAQTDQLAGYPNGRGGGPYHAPPLAMRLLAWNCRGVNKASTVRVLKILNRECSPDILFLAETKASVQRIDTIKESLGFVECFCVEANGSAGGLALFWKKGVELEVVHSDHQSKIKDLEKMIEEVRGRDPTRENLELEASLCLELEEWLGKEEIKWKKKSRELWLREGDHNSRFFHLSTIIRRRSNRINEIKLEDGTWLNNREDIGKYFTN